MLGTATQVGTGIRTWLRRNLYAYSVAVDAWYYGRDSQLAGAIKRWFAPVSAEPPAPPSAPPTEAKFLRELREQATTYYTRYQGVIDRNDYGWQQAEESYAKIAVLASERRIPLVIMVVTNAWDGLCATWECRGVRIRYQDVAGIGRSFYARLEHSLGRLTPHYLSLERLFGPLTLEQLYDGAAGHYGPKKNALISALLASTLSELGIRAPRHEGAERSRE
jgi:hypothetical protein